MRILQLGRFYPPSAGGIQTAIYNIREGLAARGLECDVLCCGDGLRSRREAAAGGTIYRAGSLGTVLSTSLSPAIVLTLMRIAPRYDIIHLHHPDPMATLALFVVRPKAALVVHWHSDIVRQKAALRMFGPLQAWLLKRAARVIVTTPAYLPSPFLRNFRDKIEIVPVGIETEAAPADDGAVRRVSARHANKFLVFSLGRMVYYKGFEYLINAAARLDQRVHVVIGGDGPLLNKMRRLVDTLGLQGRVFLPGALPAAEVEAYYRVCDVFCLSSTHHSEAFGIVQLEAMKFGKPVIATTIAGSGVSWVNAGGISGINVAPRDRTALAAAIEAFVKAPSLGARLGRQGRRRLLDLFTRERMCRKLHRIYQLLPGIAAQSGGARSGEVGEI